MSDEVEKRLKPGRVERICETCGWWLKMPEFRDRNMGECRVNPPVWPHTNERDFCGSWQSRKDMIVMGLLPVPMKEV